MGGGGAGGVVKGMGSMKRKAGAVTVEEYISGDIGDSDGYETLDARAIDAAKWTDKSVQQMIHEISTRGHSNGSGQTQITFGQLFDETANIFDALVGILKTARKYVTLMTHRRDIDDSSTCHRLGVTSRFSMQALPHLC